VVAGHRPSRDPMSSGGYETAKPRKSSGLARKVNTLNQLGAGLTRRHQLQSPETPDPPPRAEAGPRSWPAPQGWESGPAHQGTPVSGRRRAFRLSDGGASRATTAPRDSTYRPRLVVCSHDGNGGRKPTSRPGGSQAYVPPAPCTSPAPSAPRRMRRSRRAPGTARPRAGERRHRGVLLPPRRPLAPGGGRRPGECERRGHLRSRRRITYVFPVQVHRQGKWSEEWPQQRDQPIPSDIIVSAGRKGTGGEVGNLAARSALAGSAYQR
jgi:hypothetical protein